MSPGVPHPGRRARSDVPFIGRGLRDVWAHFTIELAAGVRERYPQSTTASNQVMMLIDAEGTRVSELARRAQVTKQTMAQAVELLEEHGLVARRPDPSDGRAKLVELTAAGWDAVRHGLAVATTIHDRWTGLLGPRDMLRLVKLLDRLADALDEVSAPATSGPEPLRHR